MPSAIRVAVVRLIEPPSHGSHGVPVPALDDGLGGVIRWLAGAVVRAGRVAQEAGGGGPVVVVTGAAAGGAGEFLLSL